MVFSKMVYFSINKAIFEFLYNFSLKFFIENRNSRASRIFELKIAFTENIIIRVILNLF